MKKSAAVLFFGCCLALPAGAADVYVDLSVLESLPTEAASAGQPLPFYIPAADSSYVALPKPVVGKKEKPSPTVKAKPAEAVMKPQAKVEKPAVEKPEPVAKVEKPAVEKPEPVAKVEKPAVKKPEPAPREAAATEKKPLSAARKSGEAEIVDRPRQKAVDAVKTVVAEERRQVLPVKESAVEAKTKEKTAVAAGLKQSAAKENSAETEEKPKVAETAKEKSSEPESPDNKLSEPQADKNAAPVLPSTRIKPVGKTKEVKAVEPVLQPLIPTAPAPVAAEKQIVFAEKSDRLSAENLARLEEYAATLAAPGKNKIIISAYNFEDGGNSFKSKRLNLNRAVAVRSFLMTKGYKNFSIRIVNTGNRGKRNVTEIEEETD